MCRARRPARRPGRSRSPHREVVKALLHFIRPASSVIRHFTEIETGDCVIEYAPDIYLEGRQELRFVVEGINREPFRIMRTPITAAFNFE
jgi:hypothetical protein